MIFLYSSLTISAAFELASGCCPNKLESCEPTWPISPTHLQIFHTLIVVIRHSDTYFLPNLRLPPEIKKYTSVTAIFHPNNLLSYS